MSLKIADVHRIAHLARIQLSDAEAQERMNQLNDILAMIEQIGRVDTKGILPMSHPLDGVQRLREDAVSETPDRGRNLRNAPAQEDGLFLVPRVIE
jgi:aspartyl-tRNA(Asn)/glutamyl-tRNA(Gln) amidotransferase subunit C